MLTSVFSVPPAIGDSSTWQLLFSAVTGIIFSLLIALPGYRKKSLNASGAAGAVVLGGLIFFSAGLAGFLPLILFFISSSILSKTGKRKKAEIGKKQSEGSRRSIVQVFANGGPGAAAFLWYRITGNPVFFIAGCACLCGANADTWASEGGVLFDSRTVLVTTFRPVERGESGGVSIPGTLLSLGGSFVIALICFLLLSNTALPVSLHFLPLTTALGFAGSLIDSLLGASVQGIYKADGKYTEKRLSSKGAENEKVRGTRFVNNSGVNLFSGLSVLLLAILFA